MEPRVRQNRLDRGRAGRLPRDERPRSPEVPNQALRRRRMTTTIPSLTLNNGVEMPALGLGVFQTPPDETTAAVEAALSHRLSPYRHRRGVRQRARGRRGHPEYRPGIATTSSSRPRSGSATTATTRRCTRSRRAPAKLGVDQIDLLILHQALPSEFDTTDRGVQGARDAARGREGARDRRQQLHARAPRLAAGAGGRRSCREPDRAAPVLHAGRDPARAGRPSTGS